jgi:hypothetical protein
MANRKNCQAKNEFFENFLGKKGGNPDRREPTDPQGDYAGAVHKSPLQACPVAGNA